MDDSEKEGSGLSPPEDGRPPEAAHPPSALPSRYNVDRVVLMPRDPQWLYAYWELTRPRLGEALAELGVSEGEARAVLRVHDVTDLVDAASGRPRLDESKDPATIEVAPSSDHWYIKVERPDRLYCVEYLLVGPDGRTVSLATSNLAATPSDRAADQGKATWVTGPPEMKEVPAEVPTDSRWQVTPDPLRESLSSSVPAEPSDPPPGNAP